VAKAIASAPGTIGIHRAVLRQDNKLSMGPEQTPIRPVALPDDDGEKRSPGAQITGQATTCGWTQVGLRGEHGGCATRGG